jgi:hypothetical protein
VGSFFAQEFIPAKKSSSVAKVSTRFSMTEKVWFGEKKFFQVGKCKKELFRPTHRS